MKKDTLMLIPGLGQTSEAWRLQEPLGEHFDIITPPLIGSTISEVAENLVNEVQEKIHLVGLSLGGVVALEMYRRQPNSIRSLTLANTLAFTPLPVAVHAFQQLKTELYTYPTATYLRRVVQACVHQPTPDLLSTALRTFAIDNRGEYLTRAHSCLRANYLTLLPDVDVPVLLIGGRYDRITPPPAQRLMHGLLPRSTLQILPCGHLSNLEQPRALNRAILEFVTDLDECHCFP